MQNFAFRIQVKYFSRAYKASLQFPSSVFHYCSAINQPSHQANIYLVRFT